MDASPFARLAAELRNKIYELVLTRSAPIGVLLGHTWVRNKDKHVRKVLVRFGRSHKRPAIPFEQPLALAQSCKQIHQEARQIFYSSIEFNIYFGLEASHEGFHSLAFCDLAAFFSIADTQVVRRITFPVTFRKDCWENDQFIACQCEALRSFAALQTQRPQIRFAISSELRRRVASPHARHSRTHRVVIKIVIAQPDVGIAKAMAGIEEMPGLLNEYVQKMRTSFVIWKRDLYAPAQPNASLHSMLTSTQQLQPAPVPAPAPAPAPVPAPVPASASALTTESQSRVGRVTRVKRYNWVDPPRAWEAKK